MHNARLLKRLAIGGIVSISLVSCVAPVVKPKKKEAWPTFEIKRPDWYRCQSELTDMGEVIERFRNRAGAYPAVLSGLSLGKRQTICRLTGRPYVYEVTQGLDAYTLTCKGRHFGSEPTFGTYHLDRVRIPTDQEVQKVLTSKE